MSEKKIGTPSVEKPWKKFYSPEIMEAPLPECSIYDYMLEQNKDHLSDIAINYLGKKITYGEMLLNINKAAAAFLKAVVK